VVPIEQAGEEKLAQVEEVADEDCDYFDLAVSHARRFALLPSPEGQVCVSWKFHRPNFELPRVFLTCQIL